MTLINTSFRVTCRSAGESVATTRVGIWIISRNRLWRESLARLLSRRADFATLTVEKFDLEVAASHGEASNPILLFDSPDSFLAEARPILAPKTDLRHRIVVLGTEENESEFIELVRHGVRGVLLKDASAIEVITAIRSVANGEVVCPPCLCRFLFDYVMRTRTSQIGGEQEHLLTRREIQILPMLARGLTNKEIASQFNIAEQTVKNHIGSILRKTGAKGRMEALDMCNQRGIEQCLH